MYLAAEAKAIKYAADNGAVILQCSWGYNSPDANEALGYTPGPKDEQDWENQYPLEKEALDYFIHNAGSPNGVIDGGLAIFASGNEYAPSSSYPAGYSKCISVSAIAATLLRLAIPTMAKRLPSVHRAVTVTTTARQG